MTVPEVHVSDVMAFFNCRRAWGWQSRLRRNLEPMRPHRPFVLGSAFHAGVEAYYKDRSPNRVDVAMAAVAKVFAASVEDFINSGGDVDDEINKLIGDDTELCTQMLLNYMMWAEPVDKDWEVIDTEREFKFGIIVTPGGGWVVDSPVSPGITFILAGRIDGVSIHKPTGTLWLREYKTARSIPEEETKIAKSLQHRLYAWAAQQLVGKPVAGVEYRFARKAAPQFPRKLNSGKPSVALTGDGEYVTPGTFRTAYEVYTGNTWPTDGVRPAPPEYAMHYAELCKREAEGQFFKVIPVQRTIVAVAQEMLNENLVLYPMPDALGWNCNNCLFRAPCDRLDAGKDAEFLLKHEYRVRVPRQVESV